MKSRTYEIGYKRVNARPTPRSYSHLSRYGTRSPKNVQIHSGKYALGNDPNSISDFSQIKKIYSLASKNEQFYIIQWKRDKMKTIIRIPRARSN